MSHHEMIRALIRDLRAARLRAETAEAATDRAAEMAERFSARAARQRSEDTYQQEEAEYHQRIRENHRQDDLRALETARRNDDEHGERRAIERLKRGW